MTLLRVLPECFTERDGQLNAICNTTMSRNRLSCITNYSDVVIHCDEGYSAHDIDRVITHIKGHIDSEDRVALEFKIIGSAGFLSRAMVDQFVVALRDTTWLHNVTIRLDTQRLMGVAGLARLLRNMTPIISRCARCNVHAERHRAGDALDGLAAALGEELIEDDWNVVPWSYLSCIRLVAPGTLMAPLLRLLTTKYAEIDELILESVEVDCAPPDLVLPAILTDECEMTVPVGLLDGLRGFCRPLSMLNVIGPLCSPMATVPADCLGPRTIVDTDFAVIMPSSAPRIASLHLSSGVDILPASTGWRVGVLHANAYPEAVLYCDCLAIFVYDFTDRFSVCNAPNLLVVQVYLRGGLGLPGKFERLVRRLAEWYPRAIAFQVPVDQGRTVWTEFRDGELPTDPKTLCDLAIALAHADGTVAEVTGQVMNALQTAELMPLDSPPGIKEALLRHIVLKAMDGPHRKIDWH